MSKIEHSVDCVVFGFEEGHLKVLLIQRKANPQAGMWALPGDFLNPEESLNESASKTLKKLTSLENIYLEQIRAFGETHRYPEKRVITVGYFSLINITKYRPVAGYQAEKLEWHDVNHLPDLAFDHKEIISEAHEALKKNVRYMPIGFNLLPEAFSLTELQQLYEAILQVELNKRNFRTRLNQMKLLVDTGKKQEKVAHKPAKLYRFDTKVYQRLKKEGFYFKL